MRIFYFLASIALIAAFMLNDSGDRRAPTPASTQAVDAPPATEQAVASQPVRREAPAARTVIPNEFGRADVGKQVRGSGSVVRILSDDNEGSRHQRFILRLASGQTVLVAHNIDLAPRVGGIAVNDSVEFYGEYEWNSQGGVVHWTHNDPNDRHTHGWLKSKGRTYQ